MKKQLLFCFLFCALHISYATTYYVTPTGAGSFVGTSWADASADLQSIINAAASGDEIWVAAGTYLPTRDAFGNAAPSDNRDKTFLMKTGVAIYGGFVGTETLLTDRPSVLATTILSGDLLGNDVGFTNNAENAYHVVTAVGTTNTSILDGFTITKGYANGVGTVIVSTRSVYRSVGGGIFTAYAATQFVKCAITANTTTSNGGGGYFDYSPITLSQTTISGNTSPTSGGGFYANASAFTLTNTTITGNTATSFGGGFYANSGSFTAMGCTISGNTVTAQGGGFYANAVNPLILTNTAVLNHTIANNGSYGAGMFLNGCMTTVTGGSISGNVLSFVSGSCFGVGAYVNGGRMEVTGTLLRDNLGSGGGCAISASGAITNLLRCAFFNNKATNYNNIGTGGGIQYMNTATGTITSCVFANNIADGTADDAGGAIMLYTNSIVTVQNCTFYNNSTTSLLRPLGGTLSALNSTLSIKNSIVVDAQGNSINSASSTVTTSNSSISSVVCTTCGTTWNGGFGTNAGGNITTTPLFVNTSDLDGADNIWMTADDGLALAAGSSAINVGNSTGAPTTDILSAATVCEKDMGAYEYQGTQNITPSVTLNNVGGYMYCNGAAQLLHLCAGTSVTLTATPIGGGATPTYAWSKNGSPVGTNSATYTDAGLANNDVLLCTVTSSATCLTTPTATNTFSVALPTTKMYVKSGATGNGTSWSSAYGSLYDALAIAPLVSSCVSEIWVAAGTYKPENSCNTGRTRSFALLSNLALYGGFVGTEVAISQRPVPLSSQPSILSGDIGVADIATDNVYHVLKASNITNFVLNGFTITKGNANATGFDNDGGGILISGGSRGNIQQVIFSQNACGWAGGAIRNSASGTNQVQISNCVFANNTASYGGGYLVDGGSSASTDMTNCVFSNNIAAAQGGAIYSASIPLNLWNNTLTANIAPLGAAIICVSGTPTLRNSIVWGNTGTPAALQGVIAATYSDIQQSSGIYAGVGNINSNPLFVATADHDGADNLWQTADDGLLLQCTSPAVNAGTASGISATTDLTGGMRNRFGAIDMGAYENSVGTANTTPPTASPGNIQAANVECTTADGWTHYFCTLDNSLLLSLKKNGQTIGTIGDGTFAVQVGMPNTPNAPQNLSSANYIGGSGSWWVMNRTWNIVPNPQPTDSVGVRFYYETTEYTDMNNVAGTNMAAETEMRFYKLNGFAPSPWSNHATLTASNVSIYLHAPLPTKTKWTRQTTSLGKPYAEYYVTSFSGGGGGSGTATILSVADVQLSVVTENKNALLSWVSSNDGEASRYAIERGTDANALSEIGQLPVAGAGEYAFTDEDVAATQAFYRIRREDKDGEVHYSNLVEVNMQDKNALSLMLLPNPTEDLLRITVAGNLPEDATLTLYDAIGKEVLHCAMQPNIQLSLADFAAGIYSYRLSANGETLASGKVIKQ